MELGNIHKKAPVTFDPNYGVNVPGFCKLIIKQVQITRLSEGLKQNVSMYSFKAHLKKNAPF